MRRRTCAWPALVLAVILVVLAAAHGCGGPSAATPTDAESTTTTISTGAGAAGAESALEPGEALAAVKQDLERLLGLPADRIVVSTLAPASAGADMVLLWTSGKAEVDSATGRIYLLSVDRAYVDPRRSTMSEVQLEYEAKPVPGALGWPDSMLAGLGFRQEGGGSISEDTHLFALQWQQYDSQGVVEDGFVDVYVDSRTGDLVSFSVSLGSGRPDIAGAISVNDAMDIAQTCIFLETDDPDIALMGDGSLILLGKTVSQELTIVEDKKITKGKPLLCWVIFLSGTVAGETVGGTVYIDATTGEVLSYQPLSAE